MIASKFPSRVITVDLDPAISGDPTCFADIVHLNENGHARAAEALYRGLLGAARGIAAHARGNVKGSGLRTVPHDAEAAGVMNLIQPAYPRRPGLLLRQSERATTPMFPNFVDNVAPMLGVENRDSTQQAWMGSYGGTNRHGGSSTLSFFAEGLGPFDGLLAEFADTDDTVPRFSILAAGSHTWGPGGASNADVTFIRSAAGEMTLDGPGASVADLTVTGDITAGSINAPLGGSSFTVNNPGGAGSGTAYRVNQAGVLDGVIADFTLSSDAHPRFSILGLGVLTWGPGGGSSFDTRFYRSAAGELTLAGPAAANADLIVTGKFRHLGSTLGFYNAAAVARPAAYTQTYTTASRTHANLISAAVTASFGTSDATLADVTGTHSQSILNNNFQDLATYANAMRVDIAVVKNVLNQVIDDLQTLGLLQ